MFSLVGWAEHFGRGCYFGVGGRAGSRRDKAVSRLGRWIPRRPAAIVCALFDRGGERFAVGQVDGFERGQLVGRIVTI